MLVLVFDGTVVNFMQDAEPTSWLPQPLLKAILMSNDPESITQSLSQLLDLTAATRPWREGTLQRPWSTSLVEFQSRSVWIVRL